MKENLEPALARVKTIEGKFQAKRSDPGNWTGGKVGKGKLIGTKYGIAANTYPNEDIKNLTWDRAKELYRRDYAAPVRFDELPGGVDFVVLDFAINSGSARAVMALQRAVGVADDGKIGPVTMAAARKVDAAALVHRICADRLAYMSRLKNWPENKNGWRTRVAQVEAAALKLSAVRVASAAP